MTAALDADDQARIAAQIVTDVGMPAVARYLPEWRAPHPGRGRAVLACRCGRVLDADQMHRPTRPRRPGDAARIDPITCWEHAT